MPKTAAYVCAALVALSATGCTTIAHKLAAARAFSAARQPGHQYQSMYTPSGSMEPTIHAKSDYLLVDESAYDSAAPQRGDIIVFMSPTLDPSPFVKRVIALPGDTLVIRGGQIRVNGRPLPANVPRSHPHYDMAVSRYRLLMDGTPLHLTEANIPPRSQWTAPDRLPPRCYFVIGDYADNSLDSHVFGCAELQGTFSSGPSRGKPAKLVGKVVKIIPGANG